MVTQTATTPPTITDTQLQQAVMDALTWDQRLTPSAIGVSVQDGVVTLTSDVSSYGQRTAAQEDAHRLRGVLAVANDLSVALPGATERTDVAWAAPGATAVDTRLVIVP